jgi:sugar (pentulose or hexulose) kinase
MKPELIHIRRVPFPAPISGLDPLKYETDPLLILDIVRGLITDLVNLAEGCEGIVMCGQMHSIVLMNDRGEIRSNCIGWRDQRALAPHPSGTGSYYEVLQQKVTEKQRRDLGNELPAGSPLCFLFQMSELSLLEPSIIPTSLPDFVLANLCEVTPSVETTNAMAYELVDLRTLQWHTNVIRQLGLDKVTWPAIRQSGDIVGFIQMGGRKIPCYTPVGDYQCALVGAMLVERELSLNISTGSQVSRLTNSLELGDYQTRPFFDGKFTNTLSHLPAGRSLNVLVDLLEEIARGSGIALDSSWAYIAQAVAAVDCTDLSAKLTFFRGPCGDRGAITNISETNLNVGTLFRAAFENMAENYYSCALRVWPDRSWSNIVFSGGLAEKLPLLRHIIEDRFQAESRLSPVAEDTMFGLLALATSFSGEVPSVEDAVKQLKSNYNFDASSRN